MSAAFERDALEPFLRLDVVRKSFLLGAKSFRVVEATPLDDARGVLDVQHFVIQDIFDEPLRDIARVERLAVHDGLMHRIVVTENAARPALRPCERRLFELVVKKTPVEPLKHAFEVIESAARR